MNFLKKLGGGLKSLFTNKQAQAVGGSLLTALFPAAGSVFAAVAGIVSQTELMFTSAFGDKKVSLEKAAAALPFVEHIITNSEILIGKEVVDETRFIQGCQKVIAGVVDILHAVNDKPVELTGQPESIVSSPPATSPATPFRTFY